MSTDKERPTPPPIPSVNRETGKVTITRPEDVEHVDGWAYSEDPYEGGMTDQHRFNNADDRSEKDRAKAVAEFNRKADGSLF